MESLERTEVTYTDAEGLCVKNNNQLFAAVSRGFWTTDLSDTRAQFYTVFSSCLGELAAPEGVWLRLFPPNQWVPHNARQLHGEIGVFPGHPKTTRATACAYTNANYFKTAGAGKSLPATAFLIKSGWSAGTKEVPSRARMELLKAYT